MKTGPSMLTLFVNPSTKNIRLELSDTEDNSCAAIVLTPDEVDQLISKLTMIQQKHLAIN